MAGLWGKQGWVRAFRHREQRVRHGTSVERHSAVTIWSAG